MTATIHTLIQAVEVADSKPRMVEAVRQLALAQSPDSIPALIQVLGYNNPGAAVAAVDGLVRLGDVAVRPLLNELDGYNYGARAWAIRALSEIAHPDGLEILLAAAQADFALSVRRAAARGLGRLRWRVLPADELEAAQEKALATLLTASQDQEWVVRYAAIVGLQALAEAIASGRDEWRSQIHTRFEQLTHTDDTLAVRSRALWGLQCLKSSVE